MSTMCIAHRYIDYESKLEELRRHRHDAMAVEGSKTLADFAGVRRIHFIFERATTKFRGDLRLWMRWLAYCRESGSRQQMSRVRLRSQSFRCSAPGNCSLRHLARAPPLLEFSVA